MVVKSIYKSILENLEDGVLKPSFYENTEYGYPLYGSKDGNLPFDSPCFDFGTAAKKLVVKAFNAANAGDIATTDEYLRRLGEICPAIIGMADFSGYIGKIKSRYPADRIFDAAMAILTGSRNPESIKYCLALTYIIDNGTEEELETKKKVIRTLALCEEFTFHAAANMSKWENGNEEIFDLCKRVHGWGKINAIILLQPETAEIRDWLLKNGLDNTVCPGHSALPVWDGSGAAERLASDISEENFRCCSEILYAFTEDAGGIGYDEIEEPERCFDLYLKQAARFRLTLHDYTAIHAIGLWAGQNGHEDIRARAHDMVHTEACRKLVEESVKSGESLALAEALDIPYAEYVLALAETDLERYTTPCLRLMDSPEYGARAEALFKNHIPASAIGTETDPDAQAGIVSRLFLYFFAIGRYPLTGKDVAIAALRSGNPEERRLALQLLYHWTGVAQVPLRKLSDELYIEVARMKLKETDAEMRQVESDFLDGMIGEEL